MHDQIRRQVRQMATVVCVITVSAMLCAQGSNGAASLPPAVKKAFDQSYPGATIAAVSQTTDNKHTAFRVDSADKGRRRVVLYDATGKALEVAEYVQEKELPKPVADAMHSHRRAIYVSGMKVTRGGNVEYRLKVRGSRKTAMIAKPDGTVLSFK